MNATPWIETYTGHRVELVQPNPETIDIEDIAHALSNLCRYTGHCRQFYSVAEHCVLVSSYLDQQGHGRRVRLLGLLHDATEAYLADISKPLKALIPPYVDLERGMERAIHDAFGLVAVSADEHQHVKYADCILLATEAAELMPSRGEGWPMLCERVDGIDIACLDPDDAKAAFLSRYDDLAVAR